MPVFGFRPRFAELVKRSEKKQTIRKNGKRRVEKGQPFIAYEGLRTKHCTLVKKGVITNVRTILITCNGTWVNDHRLSPSEGEQIARDDGFITYDEFVRWFGTNHHLPFEGVIIEFE